MGTRLVDSSASKGTLLVTLAALALAPLASSAGEAPGLASAVLLREEPAEGPPSGGAVQDAVYECTVEFPSGGAGSCQVSWWQTGNLQYSVHLGFHDLLVMDAYSRLIWMDAANRMMFLRQCDHTVTVQELGWQECLDSSATTYREGWQTIYVYGEADSCSLGTCVLHGKITIS